MYVYICMYICVCVCVCEREREIEREKERERTQPSLRNSLYSLDPTSHLAGFPTIPHTKLQQTNNI